jgi:hypothetical protein
MSTSLITIIEKVDFQITRLEKEIEVDRVEIEKLMQVQNPDEKVEIHKDFYRKNIESTKENIQRWKKHLAQALHMELGNIIEKL